MHFPPIFSVPSSVPYYHPYYGSMMSYSSQPPFEFPGFSTQMTLGRMTGVDEDIQTMKIQLLLDEKNPNGQLSKIWCF